MADIDELPNNIYKVRKYQGEMVDLSLVESDVLWFYCIGKKPNFQRAQAEDFLICELRKHRMGFRIYLCGKY